MKTFANKTCVVTGGASGIGFALAEHAAGLGMNVVIADVESAALQEAEVKLRAFGAKMLGVVTDVSKAEQVQRLASEAVDRFGGVHLLFNNAGVGGGGLAWEVPQDDWDWVMGVNFWGIVHGARAFVPMMLAQGEGYIVNTASAAGLGPYYPSAPYHVSKSAALAFSEQLYYSLKLMKAPVGVSVLCPGWVRTRILDSSRNRPEGKRVETGDEKLALSRMEKAMASGMEPRRAAEITFKAIRARRFYVVTHARYRLAPLIRAKSVFFGWNP